MEARCHWSFFQTIEILVRNQTQAVPATERQVITAWVSSAHQWITCEPA